jgi:uncharacterized membrane protein YphA (DoxX/SURF4 family)
VRGTLLRWLPALLLGLIFLVAGLLKAADPMEFARQIGTYGIVPPNLASPLAALMIPVEIALGGALILGYRARMAAALTGALLLVFMGATAFAWSQGRTEDCGCFGSFASRTPGEVLVEDSVFLALAVLACSFPVRSASRSYLGPALVLAVTIAGGVALPLEAYRLPLDPWVTDLRIGQSLRRLPLENAPVDLAKGSYLIALLDLDAPDARDLVKRLNLLSQRPGKPVVMAFYGGEVDDKTVFCFNTRPSFEVVAVPRTELKRLYRKLPRFFQLKEGKVLRIWDGSPPGGEEVS